MREILSESAGHALMLYAEIPNPPSQLATGQTYQQLCERLEELHNNMKDPKWLEDLSEQL
jgi:hypothetical protein